MGAAEGHVEPSWKSSECQPVCPSLRPTKKSWICPRAGHKVASNPSQEPRNIELRRPLADKCVSTVRSGGCPLKRGFPGSGAPGRPGRGRREAVDGEGAHGGPLPTPATQRSSAQPGSGQGSESWNADSDGGRWRGQGSARGAQARGGTGPGSQAEVTGPGLLFPAIARPGHGSGIRHLGPRVTCEETQYPWAPGPAATATSKQGFGGGDHASSGLRPSAAMHLPTAHLLRLLLLLSTGDAGPRAQAPPQGCYVAEEAGERTFRCSQAGLSAVPAGIPNDTRKLYLDTNRLESVPAGAFQHLSTLQELDLSHNVLAHLSGAAFRGLAGTLRRLDLSANQLASVPVEAFVGLQTQVNLSANPWRCDCALQEVLGQVTLAPGTGTGIVCDSGARPDLVGQEFLLRAREEDLCGLRPGRAQRGADVALLVTMGGWLTLVVAYVARYVWQNRDESRRPLKRGPALPVHSENSSTLSTVV
ncbi:leucine-rich repeat-containing protein 3C [Heterocephalus glaber]|uniref:Leucine-rich repeat-containing protein 3C n=1 Tax=Heterocephalus glaber TaxID=10181 RepID=A0AAX6PU04_HETGA|nr:leucine-rich repeat-containing protein 3C [Heterocephalus glaber]